MPVPNPSDQQRSAAAPADIEKPSTKLQAPVELDSDGLVAEVKRIRGKKNPLSAAALKSLRDEHARTIEPAQRHAADAMTVAGGFYPPVSRTTSSASRSDA